MRGQWQPYSKHPEVLELTRILSAVDARIFKAVQAGDFHLAKDCETIVRHAECGSKK